jgi:hypothetical protein
MGGAFLFALGGVATAAQEFLVWIPQRVAAFCVVAGLAGCFVSLVQLVRVLFGGSEGSGAEQRVMLGTMVLASLPPIVFLVWVVWMQVTQSGAL